jgi:hypothetical protein
MTNAFLIGLLLGLVYFNQVGSEELIMTTMTDSISLWLTRRTMAVVLHG